VNGSSVVSLYDLEVVDAAGFIGITGLSSHTGTLAVHRCTIASNRIGISYGANGTLILRRSTVTLNTQGGVSLSSNPMFDIQNNFITRNGTTNSSGAGGLSMTGGTTSSIVQFNTIVDNQNVSGVGRAGGLFCGVIGLNAPNNIIARNKTEPTTFVQAAGDCVFTGSLVQPDFAGLMFEQSETPPFSYALKAGSPASVDMGTGTALTDDFDGEKRPNGAAPDLGADELYQ
jgi:hypothetical protein